MAALASGSTVLAARREKTAATPAGMAAGTTATGHHIIRFPEAGLVVGQVDLAGGDRRAGRGQRRQRALEPARAQIAPGGLHEPHVSRRPWCRAGTPAPSA